ncbi:hypothetical protein C8Q77DRAFT_373604 [Trametes polyzona]|nr:hypothetical protein C8Q77DRAFT_373604 [Trametes polyzona]
MSDLDADLYGDLYGNDENEFAVPTTEPEQPPAQEAHEQVKQEEQPSVSVKQEHPKSPTPPTTTTAPQPVPSYSEDVKPPMPQSNAYESNGYEVPTSSIPTYTEPPVQQIPTYEERQRPVSREPPPPRDDAGYQGVPGVDRPVRPSEMKEEG